MSDWISVKGRLPDLTVDVLYLAINEVGTKEIMIGHREIDCWTHCCCCCLFSTIKLNSPIEITHWMELPELPK
jgi:uncharacterized protein DUF551